MKVILIKPINIISARNLQGVIYTIFYHNIYLLIYLDAVYLRIIVQIDRLHKYT